MSEWSAFGPLRLLKLAGTFSGMKFGGLKGIGGVGLLVGLALSAACSGRSYNQSAADCIDEMRGPILTELGKFSDHRELNTKRAAIEHVIVGSEQEARGLASSFVHDGWIAKVEPVDEINWGVIVTEDAVRFSVNPSHRIEQLCTIAQQRGMKYRTWALSGTGIARTVTQGLGALSTATDLPPE